MMIKISTFLDQNFLNENRHICSPYLKSLQYALILSHLKMPEYVQMLN